MESCFVYLPKCAFWFHSAVLMMRLIAQKKNEYFIISLLLLLTKFHIHCSHQKPIFIASDKDFKRYIMYYIHSAFIPHAYFM